MVDAKTIKHMFHIDVEPTIPLSLLDIPLQAQAMVGKMSISGVQPKLSLQLKKPQAELVPVAAGGEYILKPQVQHYPHIPENESCCMDIAMELDIDAPPHCLLPLTDGTLAYVVKRFDRVGKSKIHQENFYQILEKKDKYAGSLEEIGDKLREISAVPGLDGQLFFERAVVMAYNSCKQKSGVRYLRGVEPVGMSVPTNTGGLTPWVEYHRVSG